MEYYLCEFEYGYSGQFYQKVDNGNVVEYLDLDGNQIILEGVYGYNVITKEPVIPSWT